MLVAALLLVPLAGAAQEGGYYAPVRGPWYIGFGIGAGDGQTYVGGTTSSFHDILSSTGSDNFRLGANFKIGAALNPTTLLGFDLTVLRGFGNAPGAYDTWVQVTNFNLMFTFFPMQQGLFLRGGGGLAWLETGIRDQFTAAQATYDYGGFDLLGGVGYAFPLTRRLALSLNADLSWQFYPWSTDVKGSRIFLAYVGLDFY
jgi:hypothetical protein